MRASLPQRMDTLTGPRLATINAELDNLDTALQDVQTAREELAVHLDDWESAEGREERAEAREAAHDQADDLAYALAALIDLAMTLVPAPAEPARVAPTPPADSPLGLLATAYRSGYPDVDPPADEQLAAIRRLRAQLDEQEEQIAFDLRLHGATWERIAEAVGLGSKQAAQQRFRAAGLLDKLGALKSPDADVIGDYQRAGWAIDAKGRWTPGSLRRT